MPVDYGEKPIAHLPSKSLELLPHQGHQNVSYGFENDGKKYVYKELRQDSTDFSVLGPDPVKVAKASNLYYSLIRKHLGEQIVDTQYLVAKDGRGKSTVVVIQPKIEGKSLLKIVQDGDGHDAVAMNNVVMEFDEKLRKVLDDPDFKSKFNQTEQGYFSKAAGDEVNLENVIQTPDKKYILVDF